MKSLKTFLTWYSATLLIFCVLILVVPLFNNQTLEQSFHLFPIILRYAARHVLFWLFLLIPYLLFLVTRSLVRVHEREGGLAFAKSLALRVVVPVALLVGGFRGVQWYNSERDYRYEWDHSVENTTKHVRGLYERDGKHRGVNFVVVKPLDERHLLPLLRNNVEWISIVPFGWQEKKNSAEIHLNTTADYFWCETDTGIIQITESARRYGMHVMLKPHLWLGHGDGVWISEIKMESEEDWKKWFASYRTFILHYAHLAERIGAEALCVGTELRTTAKERPNDWRTMIAEIRRVYRGKLTYAANWTNELNDITFWDGLDYIGVQAYYPLSDNDNPTLDECVEGWKRYVPPLEAMSTKYNKPILFTELGYKSTSDAAQRPWEWPKMFWNMFVKVSTQTQANCYEAFFKVVWENPWFAGAHIWKWYDNHDQAGGKDDIDFTPQNKAGENVMGRGYNR